MTRCSTRDRAIIKFFLYSGARIGTACRLRVKDFHQDGDEATISLHEKGDKHRRIGLHFAAAEAIAAYIGKAELSKGPLFRARLNSRSQKLGLLPIGVVTMYNLVQGYLSRLPSSMREEEVTDEDGTVKKVKRCVYTPHSLRPKFQQARMGISIVENDLRQTPFLVSGYILINRSASACTASASVTWWKGV